MKLIDMLEDLDDVQNVYSNVDIPDDVMAQLADTKSRSGRFGFYWAPDIELQ